MGTPEFAVPSLQTILKVSDFQVEAVFTQPDKKVGRKQELMTPPVGVLAKERGIKLYQPTKVMENLTEIQAIKPDVMVVVAYGEILPEEILKIPKYGVINLHASLLPKYRGASPIQTAILKGERETGVSVIKLVKEMDAGDILGQKKIKIGERETSEELFSRLTEEGSMFLVEILRKLVKGKGEFRPQDAKKATYCPKITKSDGEIKWKEKTAKEIYDQIRAFTPWPGSFTFIKNKRLKILEADYEIEKAFKPGEVVTVSDKEVLIGAKKGALRLLKVQLEGGNPIGIKEFLKGNLQLFL